MQKVELLVEAIYSHLKTNLMPVLRCKSEELWPKVFWA